MGVIKTQHAGHEKPVRLGHRFVRFYMSTDSSQQFNVHEDLICANAVLFRRRLQLHRQPIKGACPLCHEEFKVDDNDIAFCRHECGQNIHQSCLEMAAPVDEIQTCISCRKPWIHEPSMVEVKPLAHAAIHKYLHWLYTREFHIPAQLKWGSKELNQFLLDTTMVASRVGDNDFGATVVANYLGAQPDKQPFGFSHEFIEALWSNATSHNHFKDFVIQACMISNGPFGPATYVDFDYAKYNTHFLSQLCLAFTRHPQRGQTFEEFFAYWARGMFKLEEVPLSDETTEEQASGGTKRRRLHSAEANPAKTEIAS